MFGTRKICVLTLRFFSSGTRQRFGPVVYSMRKIPILPGFSSANRRIFANAPGT